MDRKFEETGLRIGLFRISRHEFCLQSTGSDLLIILLTTQVGSRVIWNRRVIHSYSFQLIAKLSGNIKWNAFG